MSVDEDLSIKERRVRWKLMEKAREDRMKRRRIRVTNRELWIEGQEWRWDREEKEWRRG